MIDLRTPRPVIDARACRDALEAAQDALQRALRLADDKLVADDAAKALKLVRNAARRATAFCKDVELKRAPQAELPLGADTNQGGTP